VILLRARYKHNNDQIPQFSLEVLVYTVHVIEQNFSFFLCITAILTAFCAVSGTYLQRIRRKISWFCIWHSTVLSIHVCDLQRLNFVVGN